MSGRTVITSVLMLYKMSLSPFAHEPEMLFDDATFKSVDDVIDFHYFLEAT